LRVLNTGYSRKLLTEEKASALLAGGIMQHGYQCGMIWGSVMAAGAQAYSLFGAGTESEVKAITAAQKLVKTFQGCSGEINCLEITDLDKSASALKMFIVFMIKGKTFSCFNMAGKFAPKAFKDINAVFAEDIAFQTKGPVSCTAVLAKKLGATEEQIVMASGLAGGIGLCGEGCGALGAAIWLHQIKKGADTKLDFKSKEAMDLIEKFLEASEYEFECADIVGRKFESIEDHAKFIKKGGCSKIIEALAKQ
jgi:hypothetical protein